MCKSIVKEECTEEKDSVCVSIVIPIYNAEKYIARCLRSIIKQTFNDYEVILVDDGSNDKSTLIIQGWVQKYSRMKLYKQAHYNAARARNFGVGKCRGKYLTFIDADDAIAPNYLAELIECADRAKSELVISGYTTILKNGKYKKIKPTPYYVGRDESWAYQCCSTWGRVYKKEFWDKNELFFSEQEGIIGEEMPHIFYANVMARNIQVISNVDYLHFQHDDSVMQKAIKNNQCVFPYDGMEIIHSVLAKENTVNSRDYYNIGLLKLFANFLYVLCARNHTEKRKIIGYIRRVYGDDFCEMAASWRRLKNECSFKIKHKIAIQTLLIQYKKQITKM